MTMDDTVKLDCAYHDVEPVMQLLNIVNAELELLPDCVPLDDWEIANGMVCSMFERKDDVVAFDKIFEHSWGFRRTVQNFKNEIVHNDKFLLDIVKGYKGVADLANSETLENLLHARENFLLDLKKTLENLLKKIPPPQFSEKLS